MGLLRKKIAPKEGHNFLREHEINWLAKVFEYYMQEGEFEIRLDGYLCLWVRFYSSRLLTDILIAPDFYRKINFLEKDGAMVVTTSKLYPIMEKHTCMGDSYIKALEDYRIEA